MLPTMKLAPRWSEPGEVLEVLTNGKTYRVRRCDGTIESVNVARLLPITASAWEEEPTLEDAGDNSDSSECYVEIEGAENDSAECLVEIDNQHDAANIHRSW